MKLKTPCKILLANPPWHDETRSWLWGVRAGSRQPHMEFWRPDVYAPPYLPFPHFLAQATALLEAIPELRVLLVDSVVQGERLPAFLGRVASFAPQVLFIETSTPSLAWDLDMALKVRTFLPDVLIGFGGAHAPLRDAAWLGEHPQVDFACFGEYELSLEALMRELLAEARGPVVGVHYRGVNGRIIPGPVRPPCQDLDAWPRYAYHHLPMQRYTDNPFGLPAPSAQIWSSRGCPLESGFCVWSQVMYGQPLLRLRSLAKVVDEVEWLVRTYDFQSFYFDDDITNVEQERTMGLAREIASRRLGVPWAMRARADLMDRAMLETLHAAGMRAVKYGLESASQDSLELEKVKNACRITRELGIRLHLTFMFDFPGEASAKVQAAAALALELDPDTTRFSLCTPFPGTLLHVQAGQDGWLVDG